MYGGPHNEALQIGIHAPRHDWSVVALLTPGARDPTDRFVAKHIDVRHMSMVRVRRTADPSYWLLYPCRFAADVVRLTRVIRREHIDLVEGSSVNLQAALAAKLSGIACVWRVADITVPSPIRRVVSIILPFLADEILVNGDATRAAYLGLHSDRAAVTTYFPIVDDTAFFPRPEGQGDHAVQVVGTVANINPDKGIDLFVEACGLIAQRGGVRFVIVGAEHDGHRAYAERIRDRVDQLGIGHLITFVGGRTDVPTWMRAMDVFVISSRREGTTTTAIEAMASGLAIVSTDVGAIHEVIEDGRSGRLVPPGDPRRLAAVITEILGDEVTRETLGSEARRQFELRFSTADLLSSRLGSYSRALSRKRPRRKVGDRPRDTSC